MNNKSDVMKVKQAEKPELKPRLRFPEFRKVGQWEKKKIGKLLIEQTRPIEMEDLQDYSLVTVKRRYGGVVSRGIFKGKSILVKSQFLLQKDDFLISKRQIVHNACGIVPPELDGSIVSNEYSVLRARNDCDINFIYYFSQQPVVSKSFMASSVGIVIEKMLFKLDDWLNREFLFPRKNEQTKISDCLSCIDKLITTESQKLDALKAHKKGLIGQLFPAQGKTLPRLRFPDFLDSGDWEERKLGEMLLATPSYGVNAPAVPYSEALPAYLRITDISDDGQYLTDKKVSVGIEVTDENYLNDGDIVLARTGASVGKSYKYKKRDGRLVYAGFLIRIRPDPDKIDSKFLSIIFLTQQYWKWVAVNSARSGQPGINASEYAALPLSLPSINNERGLLEQQKIADCLYFIDELIAAEAKKLDTLKSYKKGLLQQLFPMTDEVQA